MEAVERTAIGDQVLALGLEHLPDRAVRFSGWRCALA
jgi:hypothetical protein